VLHSQRSKSILVALGKDLTTIAIAALVLAVAGTSLLVDPRAEAAFDAPKRLISLLGVAAASVCLLSTADFDPTREWRIRSREQQLILALVAIAVVGAIVAALASPHRPVSLDALRVAILYGLLLPLGASRLLDGQGVVVLIATFVIASVINASISIFQAVGFQPLPIEKIVGRVSSVGLVGNEGYLGLLMATAAVSSLGVAGFASSQRIRSAGWAAMAPVLIALALSRNVTGWIALAVGSIPLAWNRRAKSSRWVWPGTIATALASAVIGGLLAASGRLAELVLLARSGNWDRLLSYRLGPWAAALEMIRERPILGFGPGTFGPEFVRHRLQAEIYWGRRFVNPQLSSFYAQAHCDYLQGLAEFGIPAGLCAAFVLVGMIASLARNLSRLPAPEREEAKVTLAILLTGAVGALAWSPFQQPAIAVPMLLAAGRGWRLLSEVAHH
jgi:O-antigen ligase